MWQEKENSLYREFIFDDFKQAFTFMTRIADIAEECQHHPRWTNEWNKVEIWLSTHDKANSVTTKDRKMAERIDAVYELMR
jgi:4a-hydroxytetrahydrobiopterin dehydratase